MPGLKLQNKDSLTQKLAFHTSPLKIYAVIITIALISGVGTGYVLASSKSSNPGNSAITNTQPGTPATNAQQDTQTFRDFAEGVIQKKPPSPNGDYSEGTDLLIRQNAVPVALTSSVVD